MQIVQVDLDNFKSYRNQSISFTAGTNAICGPNGAGKSTILEAIGFVLFGSTPLKNRGQFVREGEKTATATVHIAGDDGRVVQVVRKAGSSSQCYVYDPEIGAKLVEGVADTTDWLCQFAGVAERDHLTTLFENAVGVPQGMLTAAFLLPGAQRKGVFDPLLRVDEYETVWNRLLEPRRELDGEINEHKTQAAELSGELKGLPAVVERATSLQSEIDSGTTSLANFEGQLTQIVERRQALEAVKSQLDQLSQSVAQAESATLSTETQHTETQGAVASAEQARTIVEAADPGHRAFVEAQAALDVLEAQRSARDALEAARQTLDTGHAVAQQRIVSLEAELGAIAAAEAEMEALAPQVTHQEQLEGALADAQRAADRLASAEETHAREAQRLADLQGQLAETESGVQERARLEAEIAPLQAALAELTQQSSALAARDAALAAELKQLAEQSTQAASRASAAQQRLDLATDESASLELRLDGVRTGLSQRKALAARTTGLRQEVETAGARSIELLAQGGTLGAEQERLTTQISVLVESEAAECPVCGAELSPEHRADLLEENRARLSELASVLEAVEGEREQVDTKLRHTQAKIERLDRQERELPRPADETELAERLENQRAAVTACAAEAAAERAALATIETRQQETSSSLTHIQAEITEAAAVRQERQATLDTLTAQRDALPRPDALEALQAQAAGQEETLAQAVQSVAELAGAPQEVTELAAELEQLGDPRRDYQRAADSADKRVDRERERAATLAELTDLKTRIAELAGQLNAFAGLDARFQAERARQADHAADHARYLEHIRESGTLEALRERAEELVARLADARAALADLSAERDAVAGTYDAAAYSELVQTHDCLQQDIAVLTERLAQQRLQLEESLAEIERLAAVQAQLESVQSELDELGELLDLLGILRGVLREAGPKITQALVQVISRQSAQLYAEIMADHSARLDWTTDYEILLTTKGHERTFQQLSGGEQMAAALSVRLALLREVSSIDIAFFDEPTANLDERRRENLAEQILTIAGKGFSQLFVISHDDTFEQDTDNVIRIVKENGASCVVEL